MAPEYAVLRNAISVDFEKILVGKLPVFGWFFRGKRARSDSSCRSYCT
jgi:hypothetical protein